MNEKNNPVLITELGADMYESDSDFEWSNKNKKIDDIQNDEDWDTDLEDG